MSAWRARPLTARIGAVIEGADLSRAMSDDEIGAIRQALLDHQVIFFEDQQLTPVQHRDFAARFGALHTHPLYPGVPAAPEVFVLDNHEKNPTDNDVWHTDVTFIETPPMASILYARQLPPTGGDTLWSNMRAAFEALTSPMQTLLAGLEATHDFVKGFPADGVVARNEGAEKHAAAMAANPPVRHPVVRTHPETGADGLFVNETFTARIEGLAPKESEAILAMLFAHIQRPEFVVRWRWSPNAIAFWDNRVTQHYAVSDYLPHRRVMMRATVLGDRPFHASRLPAPGKAQPLSAAAE